MTPNKKQLAAQLGEAARLLELLGDDPFKVRAYGGAVRSLENFEGDFETLFEEERLTEIRGIGKGLAAELLALKELERLPVLDELYGKIPEGVRELFVVSGLGPKKIATLWRGGVTSLDDLVKASEDGRLETHKGFSKKSAGAIGEAARFALAARERLLLSAAGVYAELLCQGLRAALEGARIEIAGSLRRRLETVEGIDFVVSGAGPEALQEALSSLSGGKVGEVTSLTPAQLEIRLERHALRFYLTDPESFGAVLVLRTGNEAYLQGLKDKAGMLGYELSERGLSHDGEPVRVAEESELFKLLELPFTEPERREERAPPVLPVLVTDADICGLVHNHSSWSDGANSLRDMVAGARARGYRYLAMADHSRSSFVANGLSIERVWQQRAEIDGLREELKAQGGEFRLLHGLEVDILADGSLDYPDEVLSKLDYLVASVHSHFGLSEEEQTARLVRAVKNPYTGILGHATGRLLLRRPPYRVDVQAVIEACAETGTVIEINANPYRLDLDWRWVKRAKALGCTFSINPDAHHVEGFDLVRYGVMMARKAGLSAKDVVNTAPTAEAFLSRLKARL